MRSLPPRLLSFADGRLQGTLAKVHSMGMPATQRWTAEMLRALPDDGKRYEIVRGELLVTPSPSWTHQLAVKRLLVQLDTYLRSTRRAEVFDAPADVELETDSVVQPDVFVVPRVDGRTPRRWQDAGRLLLAVEILSPSSARGDRIVKRRLYQEHDVAEYWIVDLDARFFERWRPVDERPEIITERLEWRDVPDVAPFVIELQPYFAEVLEG